MYTIYNAIKSFCDHNTEINHASIVMSSYKKSQRFGDNLHFSRTANLDFKTSSSIDDIFKTHKNNFMESLKEIDKGNFNLKDVSIDTENLYKPNLKTLMNVDSIESRFEYILDTVQSLKDYNIFKVNGANLADLTVKRIQEVEKLKDLPVIREIHNKFKPEIDDILSLKKYFNESSDYVTILIKTSQVYVKDITLSPDYVELLSRLSSFFDRLTYEETINFLKFAEINPKLAILLMTPSLVSVLGNTMFLKLLLPLISSSTLIGPLYNWKKVIQDLKSKIWYRKTLQSGVTFYKENNYFINTTFGILSAAFPAIKYLIPAPAKQTYKEVLKDVPAGQGLENFGIDLEPVRKLTTAIGTEIGRMTGSFSQGIAQGFMDKVRPVAEKIADKLDNYKK